MKTKKINTQTILLALALLLSLSISIASAQQNKNKQQNKNIAAIIPLTGPIDNLTDKLIQKLCQKAIDQGATQIVLNIDTPGGLVYTTLQLTKYIKGPLKNKHNIKTTAWVNPQAYSAGSMISAACNQIVMRQNAQIGDCAPIIPGQELQPTERAKALSPILAEFKNSAKINNYPYPILHAMCALGVKVYKIKHNTNNKIQYVNQADYNIMVHGYPLQMPSQKIDNINTVGTPTIEKATDQNRGKYTLLKIIHDGSTLLTFDSIFAKKHNISKATINNKQQLKKFLNADTIIDITPTLTEQAALYLCSNAVRSILVMALMAGIYLEIKTPGFGIGTSIALTALALLIAGPYVLQIAKPWHFFLAATGVILILAEIFVVPGFGFTGISGIITLFLAIALMAIPTINDSNLPSTDQSLQVITALAWLFLGAILSVIPTLIITKYIYTIPLANKIILASKPSNTNTKSTQNKTPYHIGQQGKAITPLHLTGQATFNQSIADVTAEDQFIDANQTITITQIQGNKITVTQKMT